MDKLQDYLSTCFNATLSEFNKSAVYEPTMDYVEYVAIDKTTVSDRVDGWLTLLYAADSQTVVGFRLKGFRAIFNALKPVLKLHDSEFIALTMAIEGLVQKIGDQMFSDSEVVASYKEAFRLAEADNVRLDPALLQAA